MESSSSTDSSGPGRPTGGSVPADELRTPLERSAGFTNALRRYWRPAVVVLPDHLASPVSRSPCRRARSTSATAQILLQPTDAMTAAVSPETVPSSANAQRDVDTYAKLITVQPVADAVRAQARAGHVRATTSWAGWRSTGRLTRTSSRSSRRDHDARSRRPDRQRLRRRLPHVQATDGAGCDRAGTRRRAADTRRPQAERLAGADPQLRSRARLRELEVAHATQTGGVQIVRRAEVLDRAVFPASAVHRRGGGARGAHPRTRHRAASSIASTGGS